MALEAPSSERAPPGPSAGGLIAWVLGLVTAFAAGTYLMRHPPLAHFSPDLQLDRAARALVSAGPVRKGVVVVRSKQGVFAVPAGLQFDRRQAVALALGLEATRRKLGGYLRALAEAPEADAAEAYASAALRIGEFLAVEEDRARLVLYALGWPWVGGLPTGAFGSAGTLPAPLASLPAGEVARLLKEASSIRTWPEARLALGASRGLNAGQLESLRACLCRQVVGDAFASRAGAERAGAGLAKYADLVPAQAETVLAMAGALELVRAGARAAPALEVVAKSYPELAEPLLTAVRTGPAGPSRIGTGGE